MNGKPANLQAKIKVFGKVQGVFFRASLAEVAKVSGLRGWVKNASDGSVEAILQGERPDVETVIAWARKGPKQARVDQVFIEWMEESKREEGFRIVY